MHHLFAGLLSQGLSLQRILKYNFSRPKVLVPTGDTVNGTNISVIIQNYHSWHHLISQGLSNPRVLNYLCILSSQSTIDNSSVITLKFSISSRHELLLGLLSKDLSHPRGLNHVRSDVRNCSELPSNLSTISTYKKKLKFFILKKTGM